MAFRFTLAARSIVPGIVVACLLSATAGATTIYYSSTGTLANPTTDAELTIVLPIPDTVNIQTWGFGGGTNANGVVISAGGFDPLIALFSGPDVPAAFIATDGSGDPLADSDTLFNPPFSFVGNCPPAATVVIGPSNVCGDVFMQVSLAAGTYTLLVSDANYVPNAVYDNGTLSEGFNDLTGGGPFQTCTTDPGTPCIFPNGNYAVDVVSAVSNAAPEPGTVALFGAGLAVLIVSKHLRNRRAAPVTNGGKK
jgi:hypothetical protein